MLEKVIQYFEKEYEETKKYLESGRYCDTPQNIVKSTIQGCLGVAMFSQSCGVAFEDVNPHYEEIVKKLKKLLDN